jgi:hypothetical protein
MQIIPYYLFTPYHDLQAIPVVVKFASATLSLFSTVGLIFNECFLIFALQADDRLQQFQELDLNPFSSKDKLGQELHSR